MNDPINQWMSFADAGRIGAPVVYGICRRDDPAGVVYVGQTKKPAKRFDYYRRPTGCHNELLKPWLRQAGEAAGIVFLAVDPPDIHAAERKWIGKLRPQLFNLLGGGEWQWREHQSQPWMAGTGVKCPSALAIGWLKRTQNARSARFEAVLSARRTMGVVQRCVFEMDLCRDLEWHIGLRPRLEHWLDVCGPKLKKVLEEAAV